MRTLKMNAWEPHFVARLSREREEEASLLRKTAWTFEPMESTLVMIPYLVTLATFGLHVFLAPGEPVTADKVFTALVLINHVRIPLLLLPKIIMSWARLKVSRTRLEEFLKRDEEESKSPCSGNERCTVFFDNVSFLWPSHEGSTAALTNLRLKIEQGSLVAIVGKVGSGKSALLSAILGEMEPGCEASGHHMGAKVGSVSFVPQQSWIRSDTLREYILFGSEMDEKRYLATLEACALLDDLRQLPDGDLTQIGENGTNLSGGQRQRVSIARAVYHRHAGVVLMDDPLSAVDASVVKHIFEHVLSNRLGLMRRKTRIFTTHNFTVLPEVNRVVVMDKGRIAADGSYQDLCTKGVLENLLQNQDPSRSCNNQNEEIPRSSSFTNGSIPSPNGSETKVVEDEIMSKGSVDFMHYVYFLDKIGRGCFSAICVLFMCRAILEVVGIVVLGEWTDTVEAANASTSRQTSDVDRRFVALYASVNLLRWLVTLSGVVLFFVRCASASSSVHGDATDGVFHSPLRFFEANPGGRILNRFSADLDAFDQRLPRQVNDVLHGSFAVVANLVRNSNI